MAVNFDWLLLLQNMNGNPSSEIYSQQVMNALKNIAQLNSATSLNGIPVGAMTASLHAIGGNKMTGPQQGGGSGMIGQMGDMAAGMFDMTTKGIEAINPKTYNSVESEGISNGINNIGQGIGDAVGSFNPIAGAAIKTGFAATNAMGAAIKLIPGARTDGVTKRDRIADNNYTTLFTLGLNGFLGKKAMQYLRSNELDMQTGGGYQGFLFSEGEAERFAGKKFGLISTNLRLDANRMIRNIGTMQTRVGEITSANAINNIGSLGSTPFVANRISTDLSGGIQQMRAARHGMKIENQLAVQRALSLYRVGGFIKAYKKSDSILEDLKEPESFKEGGKINVIPDGALHARLNHLNDVDPELAKEVTHKGIPVITEEGGEIVLHAEIEKEEIIFNIDVTNKLEKLRKENTDESAIEAGKLLVDEIMNNTIDNTGKLI